MVNCRRRVRYLIDDHSAKPTFNDYRLNYLLGMAAQNIGKKLVASPLSTPYVSVALVAGTYDYVITASTEFGTIWKVERNSDGDELVPRSLDYMVSVFKQDTSGALGRSAPTDYATWEEEGPSGTNTTRIRVGPTPAAADTLRVYNTRPVALSGDASDVADSATLPFVSQFLRVIEAETAVLCVAAMSDDELSQRKLSRTNYLAKLNEIVQDGIREENWRRRALNNGLQHMIDEVEA